MNDLQLGTYGGNISYMSIEKTKTEARYMLIFNIETS